MADTQLWAAEQFCYLTTTGRRTGNPHTIEIWFAMSPDGRTMYMLSGGGKRSDWVRNLLKEQRVKVRVRDQVFEGVGREIGVDDEALQARKLIVAKYYGRDYDPSGGWEASSLPIAIDLTG